MKDQSNDLELISGVFQKLGAPEIQADVMAAQLLKRAIQLAEERNISKVEAVESLLKQVISARQGDGTP